jgi:exodeoxyribonuclease VII large subunit
VVHGLALQRAALAGLEARLGALSPQATLERGYAIVRQAETGAAVQRVDAVRKGDPLSIRLQDGELGAVVDEA